VQRGNGHCFPGSVNESSESLVSAKKTTSGRMLGCYILCSESLVEVDRLTVEVEVTTSRRSRLVDQVKSKSKVEVVRHGKGIDNKSKRSTNKRSTGRHVVTD
jgi:hypothetical protein